MPPQAAQTAAEWVMVARSVAQLPDGQSQALYFMAQAESQAHEVTDWLDLAAAWQQDFQDADNAVRCLQQAEIIAESQSDWRFIADTWVSSLEDSDNAIRYMKKAESVAESFSDWTDIAETWQLSFEDSENAIRCMAESEDAALETENWRAIANVWKQSFGDADNFARCLRILQEWEEEHNDFVRHELYKHTYDAHNVELGVLSDAPVVHSGNWMDIWESQNRAGCYASFYSFTLASDAEVVITLTSSIDAYLYLLDDFFDGEILAENDDRPDDDADGLSNTDSRIRRRLPAGNYIIEATTYEQEETGAFTLVIFLRN